MRRQTIPDDQQRRGGPLQEIAEKYDNLFFGDRFIEKLEVEVPQRHTRCHRDALPVEVILQNRRLSPRRPGTAAVRALAQSAFVDEEDRAPFFLGFFLMAGHVFRFQ